MTKNEFSELIGERDLRIMSGVIERATQFPDSSTVNKERYVGKDAYGRNKYESYQETTHFIETMVRLKDASGRIVPFDGPNFFGMAGGDELVVVWRPTAQKFLRITNLTMKRTIDYNEFSKDAKGQGSQLGSATWSAVKALLLVALLTLLSSGLDSGFLNAVIGIGGNFLVAYAFYVGWKKWPERSNVVDEDRAIVDSIYSEMGWDNFARTDISSPPVKAKN